MKIALVIESLDVRRGGRETSTAQIAEGLARAGHQVTVLCQRGSWPDDAVSIRKIKASGLLRVQRIRSFQRALAPVLASERFDIVHAMMPVPGANVYQLRSGTIPAQRAASLRRRSVATRWIPRWLGRLNFARRHQAEVETQLACDNRVLLLPVSQMVAQEIVQYYEQTRNTRVIYNAVALPEIEPGQRDQWREELRGKLALGDDGMLVLVLAKNYALKGVAQTIEAFGEWVQNHSAPSRDGTRPPPWKGHTPGTKPPVRLVIVGRPGVEVDGYVRHAALRGVASLTTFLPHEDNPYRWYSAADVNILLSWYDPCSRVVLEATRWGLPSITTAFNGAAEVLQDHNCGIVVPSPSDRRSLLAALDRMADPARRHEMAVNCLHASPALSVERHVDELLDAYATLKANHPA